VSSTLDYIGSNKMTLKVLCIAGLLLVSGCGGGSRSDQTSTVDRSSSTSGRAFTLYRNSPFSHSMRVHWATFDAADGSDYNRANCEMAARLLNANVDASAEKEGKPRDAAAGFWCEPGDFSEKGTVPSSFKSEFPTDA